MPSRVQGRGRGRGRGRGAARGCGSSLANNDADATTTQQVRSAWPGPHRKPPQPKKAFFSAAKTSPGFNAFYRGHTVPEEEWDIFLAAMRAPLPTTFSFIDAGGQLDPRLVQARFEATLARLGAPFAEQNSPACRADGGVCVAAGARVSLSLAVRRGGVVRAFTSIESAPKPLRCRPLGFYALGWQCDAPRNVLVKLRRSLKELRTFLDTHVSNGRINRQEAVSMLPPLLLRISPGDAVLDLCAAPGSKTVLALSRLAATSHDDGVAVGGGGCVVANDVNLMRCRRLRDRLARCRAPGALLVCHAAQRMPGADDSYDRVMCDVPCSGDGTLRKNPDIWDNWQPRASASMHPLQLAILVRGLQLLRPGGYLVYSTCSLSPVENEAVLAAALGCCEGVTLEPIAADLPCLVCSPGLHAWGVAAHEEGARLGTLAEATAEQAETWKLRTSLFPPPPEVAAAMQLEHAIRVLPHQQDTGGFFVALLKKAAGAKIGVPDAAASLLAPRRAARRDAPPCAAAVEGPRASLSGASAGEEGGAIATGHAVGTDAGVDAASPEALEEEAMAAARDADDAEEEGSGKVAKQPGSGEGAQQAETEEGGASGTGGDAGGAVAGKGGEWLDCTPVAPDSEEAVLLENFYGLGNDFPWASLLSCREQGLSRRLYLTSKAGAAVLRAAPAMRVLRAGVKCFERDASAGTGCSFRICQEAAVLLLPYLARRALRVSPAALAALLRVRRLPLPVDDSGGGATAAEVSGELAEVQTLLAATQPNGCCVVWCGSTAHLPAGQEGEGEEVPVRAAATVMKYTDKAELFCSAGEAAVLLDELGAYF